MILRCVECGQLSEDAAGWRAFLDVDDNVVMYCPDCAHREFGTRTSRDPRQGE